MINYTLIIHDSEFIINFQALVEEINHEQTWDIILHKDVPQEPNRTKVQ